MPSSTSLLLLDCSQTYSNAATSALAPFFFVLFLCSQQVPHPTWVKSLLGFFTRQIRPFLTLHEAETYGSAFPSSAHDDGATQKPKSRPEVGHYVAASIQLAIWAILSVYLYAAEEQVLFACLSSLSWLYVAIRTASSPESTASYKYLTFYVLQLLGSSFVLVEPIINEPQGLCQHYRYIVLVYFLNATTSLLLAILTVSKPLALRGGREGVDNTSPEDHTSLWQWMTFSWVTPFVRKGSTYDLSEDDVWHLSPTMTANPVHSKFSELKGKSLFRRVWAVVARDIIYDFLFNTVSVCLQYLQPYFFKLIIDSFDSPSPENHKRAYIYALLMLFTRLLKAEAELQCRWCGRHAESRLRTVLMAAIYDKALKRRDFSGQVDENEKGPGRGTGGGTSSRADAGKIVNLMSTDANHVAYTAANMNFLYGCPLDVIFAGAFLYQLLGTSAFVGLLVLLLGWPLNSILSRRAIKISKGTFSARDQRMSALSEMLSSIKFIKFFGWEDHWVERVMARRRTELRWLVKYRINDILFQVVWATTPVLVSIIAFFVFIRQGNELTVGTAFTAITLFSMIRLPMSTIPTFIVQILQNRVALRRIENFLNEEEIDAHVSTMKRHRENVFVDIPSTAFGLENASFRWNTALRGNDIREEGDQNSQSTGQTFELKNISVKFPDGKLSVISGPTASGKTALLLALLGELTLMGGRILVRKEPEIVDEHGLMHSISYAAQTPWLQHRTIKENILFGSPYDADRYNAVVECCALLPDLEILEDGDETEIGARGVNLSGGQKARVALARAVYARTKYVLLDDPLSAVDSHTSRFLYERLFLGPLLKHRTVVLVTHHVDLVLPGTGYLVKMHDGRVQYQGGLDDLRDRGLLEGITDVTYEGEDGKVDAQRENAALGTAYLPPVLNGKIPRKLVKDEKRETGGVKWSIYKTYLQASSYWTWMILLTFILSAQLLGFGEKYWIKLWGEAYEDAARSSRIQDIRLQQNAVLLTQTALPPAREKPLFYVFVYALIGLSGVVVRTLTISTQYIGALRASRRLFKQLLDTVVHATMRWYDITPAGRMLNRFSKDIETLDTKLVGSLHSVMSSLAAFFASVIVVIVVSPSFILPAAVIGYGFYRLVVSYVRTGRDLKRMDSITRSPLFSGFGELLEGIVTVRAFSAEPRFLHDFYRRIDLHQKMWYFFWMINRWLSIRLEVLSSLAIFITTLLSLSVNPEKRAEWAGWAALSLTSAMSLTFHLYWISRNVTELELDLNAVERVVEYLALPQEPAAFIENARPPAHWPSTSADMDGDSGAPLLVVEDLEIRYSSELPAVLHGVSFALHGRSRVGILGRTGSGKSTLAMSLLRFVDPTRGRIVLDGIDIATIGVHDLRARLTFIPQDAPLFSGTVRENLDPFGEYGDYECFEVLRRVRLVTDDSDVVRGELMGSRATGENPHAVDSSPACTPNGTEGEAQQQQQRITLDTEVSAGGLNFSAGQRQLIAMARALLRQSSVIILDEATSSIDFQTDAKIQKTIREEFRNALLLTIAHRLKTIIDYNRLIVLDAGRVMEFDTPYNLIRKEGGIFRGMCLKSGNYAELEEIAKAGVRADIFDA